MNGIIDSKTAGSRPATKVRIAAPQGSAFNGRRGVVVTQPNLHTVMVRLDGTSTVLPFGLSEVVLL